MRSLDLSKRVCVRCRTHTRFIREESALRALADSLFDRRADSTAYRGLRNERFLKDQRKGVGDEFDPRAKNNDSSEKKENRHERDHFLDNDRDSFCPADKYDTRKRGDSESDDP